MDFHKIRSNMAIIAPAIAILIVLAIWLLGAIDFFAAG